MTNACGFTLEVELPFFPGECNPVMLPPGFPPGLGRNPDVVNVNPDGDSNGTFDATLQVTAPWTVGRTDRILDSKEELDQLLAEIPAAQREPAD